VTDLIRVVVSGAAGRMGRAAVRAVAGDGGVALVGALGHSRAVGDDAGVTAGQSALDVRIDEDLDTLLDRARPDVLVEFAPGATAVAHARAAIPRGVRPVIGATGLAPKDVQDLTGLCEAGRVGAVIAPNFALGAVLMMQFARQAARYFPHAEVIELHHDRKRDAPSGTAAKTAQMIADARGEAPAPKVREEETAAGARGGTVSGVRVHSVRLPGLVAHQEVIFGGPGQALTIRHDSFNEESFMPGLLLAIRRVMSLNSLVYGLENVLE
jgi:4-hydroxy-tetrahydrodipicolinate reductase